MNRNRMFKDKDPKTTAINIMKTLLISLNAKCKTISND